MNSAIDHPLDGCKCGDYRRDHENGTGRCRMPNDLTHGFQSCTAFRLSHRARPQDIEREAAVAARLKPPARLPGGAETSAPRKADCLPQKPPPSGVFPPGGGPFGGE